MSPTVSIETVHQKVGRNLLLFQRLELTLKTMYAMSEISGYVSELEDKHQRRKDKAMSMTLGQAVGKHVETFNRSNKEQSEPDVRKGDMYFSMRLGVECSNEVLNERSAVLAGFVDERNALVHHLLSNYDLGDEASRYRLVAMLDEQYLRLKKEVDSTFAQGKSQWEMRKTLAEWLQSDEGRKMLLW